MAISVNTLVTGTELKLIEALKFWPNIREMPLERFTDVIRGILEQKAFQFYSEIKPVAYRTRLGIDRSEPLETNEVVKNIGGRDYCWPVNTIDDRNWYREIDEGLTVSLFQSKHNQDEYMLGGFEIKTPAFTFRPFQHWLLKKNLEICTEIETSNCIEYLSEIAANGNITIEQPFRTGVFFPSDVFSDSLALFCRRLGISTRFSSGCQTIKPKRHGGIVELDWAGAAVIFAFLDRYFYYNYDYRDTLFEYVVADDKELALNAHHYLRGILLTEDPLSSYGNRFANQMLRK